MSLTLDMAVSLQLSQMHQLTFLKLSTTEHQQQLLSNGTMA